MLFFGAFKNRKRKIVFILDTGGPSQVQCFAKKESMTKLHLNLYST